MRASSKSSLVGSTSSGFLRKVRTITHFFAVDELGILLATAALDDHQLETSSDTLVGFELESLGLHHLSPDSDHLAIEE